MNDAHSFWTYATRGISYNFGRPIKHLGARSAALERPRRQVGYDRRDFTVLCLLRRHAVDRLAVTDHDELGALVVGFPEHLLADLDEWLARRRVVSLILKPIACAELICRPGPQPAPSHAVAATVADEEEMSRY